MLQFDNPLDSVWPDRKFWQCFFLFSSKSLLHLWFKPRVHFWYWPAWVVDKGL